jgi:hypothetical protein
MSDFIELTNWKCSPLVLAKVNALLHKRLPIGNSVSDDTCVTTRRKDGRIVIGDRKELFRDIEDKLEKFEEEHQKSKALNSESLDRVQSVKSVRNDSISSKNLSTKDTMFSPSELNNAVKRLSTVVHSIAKRKLDEYGPPDPNAEPKKKIKIIPAKNVLNQDRVYFSVGGKIIKDGNQPESSSEIVNSSKSSNSSGITMAHPVTITRLSENAPQIPVYPNDAKDREESEMEFDTVKE